MQVEITDMCQREIFTAKNNFLNVCEKEENFFFSVSS